MERLTLDIETPHGKLADDLRQAAAAGHALELEQVARLAALYAQVEAERLLEDAGSAELYLPDAVLLDGVELRRPTLGALMIIERAAGWDVPDRWLAVHAACVLHRLDEPEAMRRLADRQTADQAVVEFAPRCVFGEPEFRQAMRWLNQGLRADETDGSKKKRPEIRTPRNGACECTPGASPEPSPSTAAAPPATGSGRFRRARRWLTGAIGSASRRLAPPKPGTNGATTTPRPSAATSPPGAK
jgi:hypothetical protein